MRTSWLLLEIHVTAKTLSHDFQLLSEPTQTLWPRGPLTSRAPRPVPCTPVQ